MQANQFKLYKTTNVKGLLRKANGKSYEKFKVDVTGMPRSPQLRYNSLEKKASASTYTTPSSTPHIKKSKMETPIKKFEASMNKYQATRNSMMFDKYSTLQNPEFNENYHSVSKLRNSCGPASFLT